MNEYDCNELELIRALRKRPSGLRASTALGDYTLKMNELGYFVLIRTQGVSEYAPRVVIGAYGEIETELKPLGGIAETFDGSFGFYDWEMLAYERSSTAIGLVILTAAFTSLILAIGLAIVERA